MADQQPRDPIRKAARKARARRRVGNDAACYRCGETRPEALAVRRGKTICFRCDREAQGRLSLDGHHVAGANNSLLKLYVPVNDHRAELSTAQYGWPQATLENPDHSPLLAAAGCIRGAAETIAYLITTFLAWIAEMLEALDAYMLELHGAQWWRGTQIEQWEPR